MIKRILYLGYYFKELDRKKFQKMFDFVIDVEKISKSKLWFDIIESSLKYNISLIDYFYFRFFEKDEEERKKWAGTGFMYEYQLKMNPKESRHVLENKVLFLKEYSEFIKHEHLSKTEVESDKSVLENFLKDKEKVVLKSSDGQCGIGIEVLDVSHLSDSIVNNIHRSENDLIEDYIIQHDDLMRLSPSGLNTVRIFTQLDQNKNVNILGCRLRITINSYVDNLAAGNIAAPINEHTGIVEGPGVYSDITKHDEYKHPITGVAIVGFKVPFWKETLSMVKKAALLHPENRSIGWDVAVTNSGPELLEGNHNWCKLLWQLPVKKGLKEELEKYS